MESVTEDPLSKVEAIEAGFLNRWIYCHHCQQMGEMRLLGKDTWGKAVFAHLSIGCSGVVRILPA